MKIVLDTNILRQDFTLRSRKFEMLRDYLLKTDNEIVFPSVVFEETLALFQRMLTEKYAKIIKAVEKYNKLLFDESETQLPKFNLEDQLKYFKINLENQLIFKRKNIIPLNNEHLSSIVNMAVNKTRPFFENKSEFRDALIWLTCLDIAEREGERSIIFISANVKDFADGDGKIHQSLADEARSRTVTVHYFSSLDNFLKTKASTIEFITNDWLTSNIDFIPIKKEVITNIELSSNDRLADLAESQNSAFEEISSIIQCTNLWINNYYVYEMSDGSLRVKVTLDGELEVEFSTHEITEMTYEMGYVFKPHKGDFDAEPVHKMKVIKDAGYDYFYPIVEIELHVIIKETKILSTELIAWHL